MNNVITMDFDNLMTTNRVTLSGMSPPSDVVKRVLF